MTEPAFDRIFAACGAAAWGACAFGDLALSGAALEQANALCPRAGGVLVAAFPYYAGSRPGNLSLYARGEDYHQAITRRLTSACGELRKLYPENRFVPGVDSSPLPEREIARLAGLGIQGRNGLVILPPYGSWIFLGTILTDLPLQSAEAPSPGCVGCNACVSACPGGALGQQTFDESKCLSALTQTKKPLTPEQEGLLQAHPLIWGCDLCQQVCPYNREPALSPLEDLTGREAGLPYLSSLHPEDLAGLTNRTFQQAYGNRAFAWRGPGVLRRNFSLRKK